MNLKNALSARVFFSAVLVAGVVSWLVGLVAEVLAPFVFWAVFALFVFSAATNKDLVLYCPHCKKRSKAGSTVCHHCGRDLHSPPEAEQENYLSHIHPVAPEPIVKSGPATAQSFNEAANKPLEVSPARVAEELEHLANLRDRGVLTDDEFQQQKAKLLS